MVEGGIKSGHQMLEVPTSDTSNEKRPAYYSVSPKSLICGCGSGWQCGTLGSHLAWELGLRENS